VEEDDEDVSMRTCLPHDYTKWQYSENLGLAMEEIEWDNIEEEESSDSKTERGRVDVSNKAKGGGEEDTSNKNNKDREEKDDRKEEEEEEEEEE
jgi:hypothetical protein